MKCSRHPATSPSGLADLDPRRIDELYGLEPVIEPGGAASGSLTVTAVGCPYCGETFETSVDPSAGDSNYIEDCQVCCQPIEFALAVDPADAHWSLEVRRSD